MFSPSVKFEELRREVDNPLLVGINDTADLRGIKSESNVQNRKKACKALDDVLGEIRALPGFKNFLLSPSEGKLISLARFGPVVVLNSSHLVARADAIIIDKTGISTIPLPKAFVQGPASPSVIKERISRVANSPSVLVGVLPTDGLALKAIPD
jgi:hypothetical protein